MNEQSSCSGELSAWKIRNKKMMIILGKIELAKPLSMAVQTRRCFLTNERISISTNPVVKLQSEISDPQIWIMNVGQPQQSLLKAKTQCLECSSSSWGTADQSLHDCRHKSLCTTHLCNILQVLERHRGRGLNGYYQRPMSMSEIADIHLRH